MSEPTAADRAAAQRILDTAPLLDLGRAIAQALADERAKAREPFLALANELERDAWAEVALEDGPAIAAGLTDAARRIRAAAQEER